MVALTRILAGLLLTAIIAIPVQAISVIPITFEELVEDATAVVYARVADVEGRWTADRRRIESLVTLEALRYLKGDLGPAVVMRLPGGEAGGLVTVVPGAPVLHDGDLVLLFLVSRGPTIPVPVGLTQGVFRVVRDARSGDVLVTPPPLKSSAAGRVIRGAADRRALTLDAFAAEVLTLVEAQR